MRIIYNFHSNLTFRLNHKILLKTFPLNIFHKSP
jgi:hypothetical protein